MAGADTAGPKRREIQHMRKRLISILAIGAALAVAVAGIATADKPTIVQVGNLKLTLNGGFTPKKLPKKGKPAPITLNVSGKIQTVDGTHPPAVKEIIVETDKNGSINAKGLPDCTAGKLQAAGHRARDQGSARTRSSAKARPTSRSNSPNRRRSSRKSKLVAFNGGVKGGKTTIFIHAYLTSPVSGRGRHDGHGLEDPQRPLRHQVGRQDPEDSRRLRLAEEFFELNFNRKFTYKHKQQSTCFAKCPDGHLNAKATSVLADGTQAWSAASSAPAPRRASSTSLRTKRGRKGGHWPPFLYAPAGIRPSASRAARHGAASAG